MANTILQGEQGLASRAHLTEIDCLAVLIGAVCHDYKHDGYTNLWHKNKNTDRFIQFGEEGTQEKFHFAESWKVLTEQDGNNFIKELPLDQQNRFKKRMQCCIYATDMGRHMDALNSMKEMLASLKVQSETDDIISESYAEMSVEDQQQKWCDLVVKFSDVSFQARDIAVSNMWLQLLFDEFFNQGDLERDDKLKISFLCDRETT